MKFWEAVKIWQETGALCKPKDGEGFQNNFKQPNDWCTQVARLANDWEVEEKKYTVTKSQFEKAWGAHYAGDPLSEFLKALGIE